jgi:hypothetical protein
VGPDITVLPGPKRIDIVIEQSLMIQLAAGDVLDRKDSL